MPDVALVTGGSGFVGSHLIQNLVGSGWDVHAIARASSQFPAWGGHRALHVHVDSGDTESLIRTVDSIRPSVCFHLASHFVAQHRSADVALLAASNFEFPMRLAEALAVVGDVDFVNVGTSWQHRQSKRYSPVGLYAATKQAFQDVLQFYAEDGRLRVVNLKLFDTYGPSDRRGKLVSVLVEAVRSGTELKLSPGHQLIDLVHVADVVAALREAGRLAASDPPAFGVSSGQPVSLRRLVEIFEEVTGSPLPVVWGARDYRPIEMFEPWDAGPPVPGWQPTIDLISGVKEALAAGTEQQSRL